MSTETKEKTKSSKSVFHPLAELFPVLEPDKLSELAKDIRANGLKQPILRYQGLIIDGRNRYLACRQAKVAMKFEDIKSDNPRALVASLNLHRRHLDDSQRARLAAEFVTAKKGRQGKDSGTTTVAEAARAANVSEVSVKRAKIVKERGTDELNKAVFKGKMPVAKAARIARMPKEKQSAAMKSPRAERQRKSAGEIQYSAYMNEVKQDAEDLGAKARDFAKREQAKNGIANPVISHRSEMILAVEGKWPASDYNRSVTVGTMVEDFLALIRGTLP